VVPLRLKSMVCGRSAAAVLSSQPVLIIMVWSNKSEARRIEKDLFFLRKRSEWRRLKIASRS